MKTTQCFAPMASINEIIPLGNQIVYGTSETRAFDDSDRYGKRVRHNPCSGAPCWRSSSSGECKWNSRQSEMRSAGGRTTGSVRVVFHEFPYGLPIAEFRIANFPVRI